MKTTIYKLTTRRDNATPSERPYFNADEAFREFISFLGSELSIQLLNNGDLLAANVRKGYPYGRAHVGPLHEGVVKRAHHETYAKVEKIEVEV